MPKPMTFTSFTDILGKESTTPWVKAVRQKIINAFHAAPGEGNIREITVNEKTFPVRIEAFIKRPNDVKVAIATPLDDTRSLANFRAAVREEQRLYRLDNPLVMGRKPKAAIAQILEDGPNATRQARSR